MSRRITNVISFKIESTFEEWVKIFDSKEADLRHSEFDIKPLFRGFLKMILKKLFAYFNLQREIFKSLFKQIVNGLKVTKWISQLWKNHLGYESFWDC